MWREFLDGLPAGTDTKKARELNRQYDSGLITLKSFLDQVEQTTGQRPELVEKLLDNETTKNGPLLSYIAELKQTYKIGMISNIATNWIKDKFLNQEEQGLFDDMVLSFEVGTTKPDPNIFKLACERLGVEPHETVFSDDIESYCDAARAVGMNTVHYQSFSQMKRELEAILNQK